MPSSTPLRPIVGYLALDPLKRGKGWLARYRTAEGRMTRKVLGPVTSLGLV